MGNCFRLNIGYILGNSQIITGTNLTFTLKFIHNEQLRFTCTNMFWAKLQKTCLPANSFSINYSNIHIHQYCFVTVPMHSCLSFGFIHLPYLAAVSDIMGRSIGCCKYR